MPVSFEAVGRPDNCPKCGLSTSDTRTVIATVCPDCGTPLWNRCTKCNALNHPKNALCNQCGEPTLYNTLGFVSPKA